MERYNFLLLQIDLAKLGLVPPLTDDEKSEFIELCKINNVEIP